MTWDTPQDPSKPGQDVAGYGPERPPSVQLPAGAKTPKGEDYRGATGISGTLNDSHTKLDDLTKSGDPWATRKSAKGSVLAHILKFMDGHEAIKPIGDDFGDHQKHWSDVQAGLQNAKLKLEEIMRPDGPKGQTADAIRKQADILRASIVFAQGATDRMRINFDIFSQDVKDTRSFFMQEGLADAVRQAEKDPKAGDIADWANQQTVIVVRDQYNPPISTIAQNHPSLPTPAEVPSGPGGPGGPGPGVPALPPGLLKNGLGLPDGFLGKVKDASDQRQDNGNPSGGSDGLGDAAKSASDAAGKATEGAGKAAGEAQKAATDALSKLLGDKNGSVPSTDPSRFDAATAMGTGPLRGAARGAGTGSGLGIGGREAPIAKPAAQPVASTKATSPVASASRAGLSNNGSSGGSGAPASGNHGGAAAKVHKASKALRTDHGVISEGDAVVAVVGDEPKEQPPAPTSST